MKKLRLAILALYFLFPVIMILIFTSEIYFKIDFYDVLFYMLITGLTIILLELVLILAFIYKKRRSVIKTIIEFIVMLVVIWLIFMFSYESIEWIWAIMLYLLIWVILFYITGFRIAVQE